MKFLPFVVSGSTFLSQAAYTVLAHDSPPEGPAGDDDTIQLPDGVVGNNKYFTCSSESDSPVSVFDHSIRGTNIGGWMIPESWITPSLYYQFIGKNSSEVAMDLKGFCRVLGPEEGNRQLKRHWEVWVTEEHIKYLAGQLKVNSLRLPIAEWMYQPYEPFIGCTDGAVEYVDKLLGLADKYNLTVLLDLHAVKGSQNGYEHSGEIHDVVWLKETNEYPFKGEANFVHRPINNAPWFGTYDRPTGEWSNINYEGILSTLETCRIIIEKYKDYPAVFGFEPLNEPWFAAPVDVLKWYYWQAYVLTKIIAPHWFFAYHDAFLFDPSIWKGFLKGCPDTVMDTHMYLAWGEPTTKYGYYNNACVVSEWIEKMKKAVGPVIVGEWSTATDVCVMWINGFNDNLSGYPKTTCKYTSCPDPYLGNAPDYYQPGTPIDPSKGLQGPFGTGVSGPSYGYCPVPRDFVKPTDFEGNLNFHDIPPVAPKGFDDTDEVYKNLVKKQIHAYSTAGNGYYFWNFRTELDDPQWNYIAAAHRGWMTAENLNEANIASACEPEYNVAYKCICKASIIPGNVIGAVSWVLGSFDIWDTQHLGFLPEDELIEEASRVYDKYFRAHRNDGAFCDFGGTALLVEPAEYEKQTLNCVCKQNIIPFKLIGAVAWVLSTYNVYNVTYLRDLSESDLIDEATIVFSKYYYDHKASGALCKFGGHAKIAYTQFHAGDIVIGPHVETPLTHSKKTVNVTVGANTEKAKVSVFEIPSNTEPEIGSSLPMVFTILGIIISSALIGMTGFYFGSKTKANEMKQGEETPLL